MNNWIPVIVVYWRCSQVAVIMHTGKFKTKSRGCFPQALFGTDSLVEGWNKQADELQPPRNPCPG